MGWQAGKHSLCPQQSKKTASNFLCGCISLQAGDVSKICTAFVLDVKVIALLLLHYTCKEEHIVIHAYHAWK